MSVGARRAPLFDAPSPVTYMDYQISGKFRHVKGFAMPLSQPAERKLIHTRRIECHGFEREDGLWDIEGRITDTKSYSFENQDRGLVASGLPVHDMHVRLTLTPELDVVEAEAATEASPFNICPAVTGRVAELKGLKVARGWTDSVRKVLGRKLGCTHITHLLIGPMAATAYQTIIPYKNRNVAKSAPKVRPDVLDTCHALASDGEVVRERWPQFYTGDGTADELVSDTDAVSS